MKISLNLLSKMNLKMKMHLINW